MAEFVFKGNIDSLSLRQQEFISEILLKRGCKNTEVTIETVGKDGDNYMANVKRIIAKDSNGDILKMIVKIAPTNEIARKRTNVVHAFTNEAIMYEEILPKLRELQVAAGIHTEKLLRFPECYGVLLEEPNELIVLEDLQISNFVLLDRFKPLTDNTVKMVLKNFAVLHSLSLVWKKHDQETFSTLKTKLFDPFDSSDNEEELIMFAENIERDTIDILKDERYKIAVRDTVSNLFEDWKIIFKNQSDFNQSVAIHGDGWTNNIMFTVKDGEPVECILIDYQLSKISNPVCDILYMIFNCTDHETRWKHYYEWIQYYHDELDKSLSNFEMNVESIYPKLQLDTDLKKYSKIFLSLCIMLSSFLIRKPEDGGKLKQVIESGGNAEDLMKSMQTTELDDDSVALFRRRVEGIIDSYRKFGYIDDI